jgi:uroporphyrinogen-III decarboxylase
MPFGTPEDVKKEVAHNIAIFGKGGGFVFNTVHNIQEKVPVDNLSAMFETVKGSSYKIALSRAIRFWNPFMNPKRQ